MNFETGHFALTSDAALNRSDLSSSNSLNSSGYGGGGDDLNSSGFGGSGALEFKRALAANLLPGDSSSLGLNDVSLGSGTVDGSFEAEAPHRVLAFKTKAPAPVDGHVSNLRVLYTQNKGAAPRVKSARHVPSAPERILDAPDMVDDYYLNLMDWSAGNLLAVALGPSVYLWNAATGSIAELMHTTAPDDFVTSVAWIKEGGGHLAVGTAGAEVHIYDAARSKKLRTLRGHAARVGALDWNVHLLSTGSRDSTIMHHDVRIREHHVSTLVGHTQEVCGLKWSPDGSMLASGGNDNTLCIWDAAMSGSVGGGTAGPPTQSPRHTLTDHQAAVKALAWCPWQKGLLASGGGTADRSIKLWNAGTGSLLQSVDTGSQVCSLLWSTHERELLSSHGFSQNQLTLWKYPTMVRTKELLGHTARVLHMCAAPDGSTVVSAGADETLRFWRVFGEPAGKGSGDSGSSSSGSSLAGKGSAATGDGPSSSSVTRDLAIR